MNCIRAELNTHAVTAVGCAVLDTAFAHLCLQPLPAARNGNDTCYYTTRVCIISFTCCDWMLTY